MDQSTPEATLIARLIAPDVLIFSLSRSRVNSACVRKKKWANWRWSAAILRRAGAVVMMRHILSEYCSHLTPPSECVVHVTRHTHWEWEREIEMSPGRGSLPFVILLFLLMYCNSCDAAAAPIMILIYELMANMRSKKARILLPVKQNCSLKKSGKLNPFPQHWKQSVYSAAQCFFYDFHSRGC